MPSIRPRKSPVSHSRSKTRQASRPLISPSAMPRMIVPTVWLPALPPVPSMSGKKEVERREVAVVGHPVIIMEHGIGQVLGHEEHQQPLDPPPDHVDHGALPVGSGISLGIGRDAAELEDVFSLLLPEDVHGIVVSDDADEPAGGIDDRQCQQVVLVDLAGGGFLVVVQTAEDHVALHDVFDQGGPAREDQVLE